MFLVGDYVTGIITEPTEYFAFRTPERFTNRWAGVVGQVKRIHADYIIVNMFMTEKKDTWVVHNRDLYKLKKITAEDVMLKLLEQ